MKTKNALCGLMSGLLMLAAGTRAHAAIVDITFSVTTLSPSSNIASTTNFIDFTAYGSNTGAPGDFVGVYSWDHATGSFTDGTFGFYQDKFYDWRYGQAIVSPVPIAFSLATMPAGPNAGFGQAMFNRDSIGLHSPDQSGYLGLMSSLGQFGYVELNYVSATRTLTILSAKLETTPGLAITPVPEPTSALSLAGAGLLLMARRRRQ